LAKFKDALDREWKVELDLPAIRDLRELGLNLNSVNANADIASALSDIEVFGRAIWCLCETQVKDKNLSEDDFLKGFDAGGYTRAVYAIIEAYFSFRIPPTAHEALRKKLAAGIRKSEESLVRKIESTDWSASDGTTPESSASIPPG
jgi:hypothetical protein